MHVATSSVNGNPSVGLYAYATDEYCILGPEAGDLEPLISKVLKVPVIVTTIAGTSMCGVFLAGNNNRLLVPEIIFDNELELLKSKGLSISMFRTKHTALGNTIVSNDKGAFVGPMYSESEISFLQEELGVPVTQGRIADIEVVGSCVAQNKRGALIHRDASLFEQDMIADTLKLTAVDVGSVNLGVPYVKSGIIANAQGFIIGDLSGGPEITHADQAMGFLK